MANIGNKLRMYFDSQGISQVDIAERLGVSKAYINALFNGSSTFGKKTADRWESEFGISKVFLLTGAGPMLVASPQVSSPASDSSEEETSALHMVPLLPITAQGGTLNDFVTSVKASDCERIVSPIRGVDFAIQVSGDSMAPEYPSGCYVLIKRIDERAFIEWGKTFVLDTCNGVVVKQLTPGRTDGTVTCVSLNPDQATYAPFQVSLSDVYGLYIVLMMMTRK